MQLSDLLEDFKIYNTPEQKMSKFAKEASEMPALLYPILLAMDIKAQINCIKSSFVFQNAFIDLINLEQIPQAIIDHNNRTVFPFDVNTKYPTGNSEKYTVILNMKHVVENDLIHYRGNSWGSMYSNKFDELLKNDTYYIFIADDEYPVDNNHLISLIEKYLLRKLWNGEDELHKLKKECKELFYAELEGDIESINIMNARNNEDEEYDDDGASVREYYFTDYLTSELDITDFERSNHDEIRTVVRRHIDKKLNGLVEKVSNYGLSDMYGRYKKGRLCINLTADHYKVFDRVSKDDIYTKKLANVDYYYQKEEYVKDCSVYVSSRPYDNNVNVNLGKLNGTFPNIVALPDGFGSKIPFVLGGPRFVLPNFPNVRY